MIRENLNPAGISQAIAHITALEQQAFTGGSVDSEKNSLEELTQKLNLRLITPEEAITAAEKIIAGRQDYH